MRPTLFLAALASLATSASMARAELIFGVTDGSPSLVSFDSASPGSLTTVAPITGLVAGQTLRGIDFRPSNGLLYAISNAGTGTAAQLYTISTATGVATAIGSGLTLAGNASGRISIDFNPVVDAIRVVTGSGQNYRVNANTGALIARDTDINPTTLISGVAYTNNVAGATQTTLYAYDYLVDTIDTIGSVNGTPVSPNTGQLFEVGDSGFVAFSAAMGFDISGTTGIAYLSADDFDSPDEASEFYTVNLATGAATFAGQFNVAILDISAAPRVVPEPASLAMALTGLVAIGAFARSRRRRG